MRIYIRYYWLLFLFAFIGAGTLWAGDFDPDNPPEPMLHSTVAISADPADGASAISSGGSFSQGKTISVSVTVKSGYTFRYWTLNGKQYKTSQSFSYTVGDSSVVFVAVLVKNPTLTVSVTPSGAGNVYGGGTYAPGSSRRIYTTAKSGYTFQYWTLNGEQYSTSTSFYYSVGYTDAAFVAVYKDNSIPDPEPEPDPDEPFEPENPAEPDVYYQVSVATNLPDEVKPSSLSKGGVYLPGKQLTISTSVPTEYSFLYWTLNGQQYKTTTSFTYTVGDSTANFVACFDAKQHVSTSVSPAEAGTVSAGGWYVPNTRIQLSTTAKSGYHFLYWTLNGEQYSDALSFYYYVGSAEADFVAVYEREPDPEPEPEQSGEEPFIPSNPTEPGEPDRVALLITVLSSDTSMGTVSGTPTTPVFAGDEIVITATPKPGYAFTRWNDNNTSNPRTVVLSKDAIYTAYFKGENFTITFYDDDSTTILSQKQWQYGETPTCVSPAKAETADCSYRFIGWMPEIVPVIASANYYAVYEKTVISQYPVYFLDWDGSIISQQNVIHGGAATPPADPEREGYIFTGWGSDFSNITSFTIVLAQYEEIVIEVYSVRFYDWDNTLLKTDSVQYGRDARAPSNPVREGYTFIGWDTDYRNVTMSLIVNARYRINRYCVRFLDWNGAVLKTDSIDYLNAATAPANPSRVGFTFVGWDKAFDTIRSHMDITALYEANRYPVYFVDWDGTVLSAQEAGHGGAATPPVNPAREGYTFAGWQGDYAHVYGRTIVVADYTPGTQLHTVVAYKDDLDESKIGTAPLTLYLPQAPAHAGYMVSGYDVISTPLAEGITVRTNYITASNHKPAALTSTQAVSYTVYFLDWNNTLIATQSVPAGGAATPPANPTRPGFVFTGWSADLSCITANTFAIAQYTKAQAGVYAVRFVDWDGTVLKSDSVAHGGTTTPPANPTREGYTFIGWDKDFRVIKEEMTITAQYRVNPRVCFVDWNGTVLAERIIAYGATATPPANPSRQGYTFTGWQGTYTAVTNDMNIVVAQYTALPKTDGIALNFIDGIDETTYATDYIHLQLPSTPVHTGYTFKHWLVSEADVADGITITAVFESEEEISTHITDVQGNNAQCTKVIRDGRILILRGDRIYTLTGQREN